MVRIRPGVMAAALAAFAFNPGFGCFSDAFSFGPEEMRRAVEGTWEMTVPGEAESRATFTLAYAHPESQMKGLVVIQQAACTSRSFVADAGACGPESWMRLGGRVLAGVDAYRGQSVSGSFIVSGLTYRGGALHLTFGHGPRMDVRIDGKNMVIDAHLLEGTTRTPVRLDRKPQTSSPAFTVS